LNLFFGDILGIYLLKICKIIALLIAALFIIIVTTDVTYYIIPDEIIITFSILFFFSPKSIIKYIIINNKIPVNKCIPTFLMPPDKNSTIKIFSTAYYLFGFSYNLVIALLIAALFIIIVTTDVTISLIGIIESIFW